MRGDLETALDHKVRVGDTRCDELAQRTQKEEIKVGQGGASGHACWCAGWGDANALGAVCEQERDHALESGVLDDWVDDQDECGAQSAPETLETILLDDGVECLEGRGLDVLAWGCVLGRNGLVCLDCPDWVGERGGDRACDHASNDTFTCGERRRRSGCLGTAGEELRARLFVEELKVSAHIAKGAPVAALT